MTSYFSIFKATLINLPTPVGSCLVALTGESLPVDKKAGDEAYSGEMEPRHLVSAYHWTYTL